MTENFLKLARTLKEYDQSQIQDLIKKHPKRINEILRAKSYYDLQFFARQFFSESKDKKHTGHIKDPFNKMHLDFFKDYDPDQRNIRKVILASRGSAKTTLVCLIYPLHRMCFGKEHNIFICSSTAELARGKSNDIHSEVSGNEKLQEVFGLRFLGNKQAGKATFIVESIYGECKLHSQSFASQIRGYKYKEYRITMFLLDDVVHGEEVFSEEQRIKAERQFKTDIWNAKEPGTNFVYIGTRIHSEDLGSTLAKSPTWRDSEYPAFEEWPTNMDLWGEWEEIQRDPTQSKEAKEAQAEKFYQDNKEKMNEGAKVLWPERENVIDLMKERLIIGKKAFDAEKQMIPFLSGESVFNDITYFYPKEKHGYYGFYFPKQDKWIEYDESRFVKYYALDPATGERKKQTQKKTLSQSARIIACKDVETGNLYIIDAFMDRKPPSKIIYEMCDLHHHHNFYRMAFEENLFRDMYKEHIELVVKEWNSKNNVNLKLPYTSIYNSDDKEQRIYGLEPYVTRGNIIINQHINPQFLSQLKTYPNSDHNDALDALQILWQVACKNTGFRAL